MDATAVEALLKSFQDMAKSNQDLVAAVQAGTTNTTTVPTDGAPAQDTAGAVALTNMKVPLDMGDSAEERLVNFHEWKEEIHDKLTVAGVTDGTRQTTIALMWGGRDLKTFATEKAGVLTAATEVAGVATPADTWTEAVTKIEQAMEEGINEAFAMYKFRQLAQNQRSITKWYKLLKSAVKNSTSAMLHMRPWIQ